MSDTFHGQWIVEVWQKDALFDERFIVSGSDSGDGAYAGVAGALPVVVTGAEWSITLEWNDGHGSGWQPSGIRRNSAVATATDGVVVFLGADDNYEQFRDHDYNDLVLRLRSVDPDIAPWYPITRSYDFTLPAETWRCGVARTTDKDECDNVDQRKKKRELKKLRAEVQKLRDQLKREGEQRRPSKSQG